MRACNVGKSCINQKGHTNPFKFDDRALEPTFACELATHIDLDSSYKLQ